MLRESAYGVAAINIIHLLSLTIFLGAVFIVDLRLLGGGLSTVPVRQVSRDARPWLIGGFFALLVSGSMQVLTTPIKEYYSPNFWLKMQLLAVALLFTLFVRRRITQADEDRVAPVWLKVVGLVSIGLWGWIAVNGRLIGLNS
jgi:hypothetical protein